MATINRTRRAVTRTHEGGPAKQISPEAQLRRSIHACMLWEGTFYEDGESIADRIREGVAHVPLESASQIAIEAREQMHIRHASLLVARELARRSTPRYPPSRPGNRLIGDTIARVIQRADELAEFVALYWSQGKEPLSKQTKRGLAEAFTKFDAYQLAKYDRAREVRLRDVLFLCHAKPIDDAQAETWRALVDGTLPAPDTWEVALSGGGDKREHWTRLLTDRKLGGLALLRNLRNMQSANVDRQLIKDAIEDNPFKRVLPFRFIAAARYAPDLEPDLEAAMFRACESLDKLGGKSAIVVDCSGSMTMELSGRSEMTRIDAACGLAIMLRELCDDVDVIAFGSEAALVPPRRGFALRDAIHAANVGWATYGEKGKQIADARGYDRIIVVTDEQLHDALSGPKGHGYVINTAAYQNGVGYGAWVHMDGFSENVVRYVAEAER